MGKTREFFKKIGDTKGTFHAKIIKDRNGKDLTKAEEIKKRWQDQKGLKDPDNQYGTVIHLEPDILECEVSGP